MSRLPYSSFARRALCAMAFFAGSLSFLKLGGTPPEWAGGSGLANQATKWTTGSVPGASDLAKIATGTATITSSITFGALDFSGGTIDGTNSLTLTLGTSSWNAGDLSGATIVSSGLSIDTSGSKKLINGGQLNLGGSTTWVGGNISTGGNAKVNNSGAFTTNTDGVIAHDQGGTRATFKNDGTFTKSNATAGTTEIQATFNNNNTVAVNGGTLRLSGGGSSSGTVTVANGAKLQLKDNDYTFAGGSLNGTGTGNIEISSAVTTFTNATSGNANLAVNGSGTARFSGSHTTSGKLMLAAGTVDGSGTADVGSFDWTSGNVNGKVKSNGTATISGLGAKVISTGGNLTFAGTTTWSGGSVDSGGGAQMINSSGATFTTDFDGTIAHSQGGSRATFTNNGTFAKAGGSAGATEIQTSFANAGTVSVSTGTLKLSGGGSSSNTVAIGNGAKLQIATNNYDFTAGTLNSTGTGAIEINSAVATFNGTTGNANLAVNGSGTARLNGNHATSGKLTLAAGSVDGIGIADVGSLDWTGGNVNAKVKSNGAATISGTSSKVISTGGELTFAGATTWSGGSLDSGGGAKLTNNSGATLTTNFDGTLAHNQGGSRATFTNNGTFTKSGGSTGATEIQATFANAGTVNVGTGTLKLSGGGNSSNAVAIGNGAKLQIATNNFDFAGGTLNSTGTGAIEINSAVATFNGTTGNANLAVNGSGTARFNGNHATSGKFTLAAGTVDGTGAADVGSLDWTGGNVNAKVKSNGAATISGTSSKVISTGGELTFAGATAWSGGSLDSGGGAKLTNNSGATLTTDFDGIIAHNQGGSRATFANNGTLTKSGGSSGATEIQATFNNSGTVNVNTGTLKLSGGGNSSHDVNIGHGAKLQIAINDFDFSAGALNSTGTGVIEISGSVATFGGTTGNANLAVNGAGTARFTGNHFTSGKLMLGAGTLDGSGAAEVGSLDWTGGNLNAKLKSNGAATISGGNSKVISTGGDLTFAGVTTWSGGLLNTGGGAKLTNHSGGNFINDFDGIIAHNQGGTRAIFKNDGTFTKSNGSGGETQIEARFENDGRVNINSGKLHLTGGGRNGSSSSVSVGAAGQLDIDGDWEFLAGSVFDGDGLGRLLNGLLSVQGLINIKNFRFEGGVLAGSNTFSGNVDWNGGNWNSTTAGAATIIAKGGVLNLRSNSTHDFNNRSILNNGTVNWYSGGVRGGNGSVFTNEFVFNDLNGGNKTYLGSSGFGGSSTFTNNGMYNKMLGGTTTFDVPFTNNGGLLISAGFIVFNSTFTNNGQVHLTNGATAQFAGPLTFGPGDPLTGTGTIHASSVTAGGLVSPGDSPGALNITGDLSLLTASTLLIELGGATQGSGYDFLNVGGNTVLGGTLSLQFVNGFHSTILATNTFTILTAGGNLTSAFGNIANGQRLITADGLGSFLVNYGGGSAFAANSVVLSSFVVAIPEPATWAQMILGAGALLVVVRRRLLPRR